VNEKGEEEKAAKSVTLLVTAKQAESVQLASLSGRPWLTLRGGSDNSIASLAGTTFADLRGAYPSIARDVFSALKNAKPVVQPANAQVSKAAPRHAAGCSAADELDPAARRSHDPQHGRDDGVRKPVPYHE
jgi:Flp pilus assembly protein CpaB